MTHTPTDGIADPERSHRSVAPGRRRLPAGRLRWLIAVVLPAALILAAVVVFRACAPGDTGDIVVVASGDMACDPTDPKFNEGAGAGDWCLQRQVSDIAVALRPDLVLGLGDYQYELPTAAAYEDVYGTSWGRLKEITRPALGNQEYKVVYANTFRSYFGEHSGPPEGYWSYDVGPWHFVVLNSNCTSVKGGCALGSPQQAWLEQDLAANDSRCVVAYWHHPRYSNGIAGPDLRTKDLWDTAVRHHVEMVLSGHEANYERFPRLDGQGRASEQGTRQFVAGVGGQVHYRPIDADSPWRSQLPPLRSEYVNYDAAGVLALTLKDGSYDWSFHTSTGAVLDQGSETCH